MARSRNIKPSFFKDADVVGCSVEARLLFAGLWCLADYKGRIKYRALEVKMELFPADNIDIDYLMAELCRANLIEMYKDTRKDSEHYDSTLVQVRSFEVHQNPHKNERQDSKGNPAKHLPSIEECKYLESEEKQKEEEKPDIKQQVKDALVVLREYSASNPADSLNLIPDSLNLIPEDKDMEKTAKADFVPMKQIIELYHEILPMMPKVKKLTKTREGQIRQRWKSGDIANLEEWREYFEFVAQSKFLTGKTEKPFYADLEWLTKESNFVKVWENKYHG